MLRQKALWDCFSVTSHPVRYLLFSKNTSFYKASTLTWISDAITKPSRPKSLKWLSTSRLILLFDLYLPNIAAITYPVIPWNVRWRISFDCTATWFNAASTIASMTLLPRASHPRRLVQVISCHLLHSHVQDEVIYLPLLSDPQEACVNKCADKFLKHSERVGARFGELSQQV